MAGNEWDMSTQEKAGQRLSEAEVDQSVVTRADDDSAWEKPVRVERALGIARVCTKVSLYSAKSDLAYWRTQSYQDRLAALEQIRREFHRWKYGAEPRLQRVYSVVKR
jgi:hypothetical protein